MRLFLAALAATQPVITDEKPLYALQSFMDGEKAILFSLNLVGNENFLLDSGAYTFMNSYKGEFTKEVIEEYLQRYIDFIKKYNIKYFFNLDLDTIIGIEETKKMRIRMEKEIGRPCIPVFHKIMGLDMFKELCQQYDYIAIGTIGDYKKNPRVLKQLNKIARQYNCKIHGLGYTPSDIKEYGFYSVDSTTWLNGAKYGLVAYFNGKRIVQRRKEGYRSKSHKQINKQHNLGEYIKYQEYLRRF